METKEIKIVQVFNTAINEGDIDTLSSLMTDDHTFISSDGNVVSGAQKMMDGWREFLVMFPDYKNTFDHILQDGNMVVAIGTASGTYNGNRGLVPENRIEMPAAWKAIVENDRIAEWQVFADWTNGWEVIEEDKKTDIFAPGYCT